MKTETWAHVRMRARCELLEEALTILTETVATSSKALDEGAQAKMADVLQRAKERNVAPSTLAAIEAADRAVYWLAWRRRARAAMRGEAAQPSAH